MTMPSGVIKGYLTSQFILASTNPATVNMSAGSTGTALATGDFVFMVLSSSGDTATTNTPTPPSGFTELVTWQAMGTSTTTCWAIYAKKRAGGDSNYSVTQPNIGRAQTVYGRCFWIDGAGAKDVSEWIVGTKGSRAASGGTFNTLAPSVTTTAANAMVMAFGLERTLAAETEAQLTVSGTGWTKRLGAPSEFASNTSITIASKGMASAGASGDVTFTNVNTQTTNGAAVQIVIPESVAPTWPDSVTGKLWDGSNIVSGKWYVQGSSSIPVACSYAGMIHPGRWQTITAMLADSRPFWIAHRGGSANFPEFSLHGYTQSALRGYDVLEVSVGRSSDGVYFGLHDASLDRTSLGTGGGAGTTYVASAMTWAAIQTHDQLNLGSAAVNSTHRPYARLVDILDAYIKSHIIVIDPKVALSFRTELIALLKTYPEWQERIIAKYVPGNSTSVWLTDARAAGFKTLALFYAADTFASYQAQADILGMEWNAASGVWTSILSNGKPVVAHIPSTTANANTGITNGAKGVMAAAPIQMPRAPM